MPPAGEDRALKPRRGSDLQSSLHPASDRYEPVVARRRRRASRASEDTEFGETKSRLIVGGSVISHIPADILRHGRIDAKAVDRIRRLVGQRYASLGETVTLGPRGKRRWHDRPRLGNVTKRQLLSRWIEGKMDLVAPPVV